jgi:hypothetical protein
MPADTPHRHRWAVTDFFVVEGRPTMRQTCACGELRAIPAWDRSWDPGDATDAESTPTHAAVREGP